MKKTVCILILMVYTVLSLGQNRLGYVDEVLQHDVAIWQKEYLPILEAHCAHNDSLLSALENECHDIRLRLYSCDHMGFFDLTHELHRAIKVYKQLDELAQPDKEVILITEHDVRRMQYLADALDKMPEEQALRDSSLLLVNYYTQELQQAVAILRQEADSFAALREEFEPTYTYADHRFKELITEVYRKGSQIHLGAILQSPIMFCRSIYNECLYKFRANDEKYTMREFYFVLGECFGALLLAILITALVKRLTYRHRKHLIRLHRNTNIVANALYMLLLLGCLVLDIRVLHLTLISLNATAFAVYFGYVLILQFSLLLRGAGQEAANGIRMYIPGIVCGFFLIFMRMYFIPDTLLCAIMIPLTTIVWIWQTAEVMTSWSNCRTVDSTLGALTAVIFLVTAILAACGHWLLSLQIIFWWEAQQASIVLIAAFYFLIKNYGDEHIHHRVAEYWEKKDGTVGENRTAIQITWLYDFIKMVGLPILSIASVPACLYMTLSFFNAQDDFFSTYRETFFSLGTEEQKICDLSIDKLLWIPTLYFVFNYLRHVVICIYSQASIHIERKRSGQTKLHVNQLNLTLGTNLINLIVWGLYIVVCSIMLKIPLTALTVIIGAFTGGIGFAMKDVVNNIIYGTQLMAGRLRVGDYIICDNYRGSVASISYQTTQIVTEEGALVAFTNTALFSKNFQNLTRHNPYEVNRVLVGVAYGSDIEKVERLIREAIEPLNQKDPFGRMLLSPQEGLRIEMRDLTESQVTMAVRFGVLAEKRTWFLPIARKAIYKNLTENGISIPFQQIDIHLEK